MTEDTITRYIRAKVVGVFRNGNRILVCEDYDSVKKESFCYAPGGRIEFDELSLAALRREMAEELATEIENPRLLGVVENLFTYEGKRGHEIVFVYEAGLKNKALYATERIVARESDGVPFNLVWINMDSAKAGDLPVYPNGLLQMLETGSAPE